MKIPSSDSVQLSRRLLANYLMFGLLSIITLAVGMLVIVRASQAPTSGPRLLARLSEASKRLTQDLAENNGQGIQSVVEELSKDSELQFCGVIDANGIYTAHTNPALTGLRGTISFSSNSVPGAIERVTFLREDQPGSMEYWLPLRRKDQVFGLLQVRVHGETSSLIDWSENTLDPSAASRCCCCCWVAHDYGELSKPVPPSTISWRSWLAITMGRPCSYNLSKTVARRRTAGIVWCSNWKKGRF